MTKPLSPQRKLFRKTLRWFQKHPDRWIRHSNAKAADGNFVRWTSPKAYCFCFFGRMLRFDPDLTKIALHEGYVSGPGGVIDINDTSRTTQEMLDRMAKLEARLP